MAIIFSMLLRALLVSIMAFGSAEMLHHGQHGIGDMLRDPSMDKGIEPGVTGKIRPVFFERASKVIVRLIKEKLSKARLGDLETYADGTSAFHDSLWCAKSDIWCKSSRVHAADRHLSSCFDMARLQWGLFYLSMQCQCWARSTSL